MSRAPLTSQDPPRPARSALRLVAIPLDGRFRGLMILVRSIQTYALCNPRIVDVGTQHVPALAKVQDAVMALRRPTLGCDSNSFVLRHVVRSQRYIGPGIFSCVGRLLLWAFVRRSEAYGG